MEGGAGKLRPPPIQEGPWLFYIHENDDRKFQTVYTISRSPQKINSYIKSIPELNCKQILASCHGWLLLLDSNDKKSISLWNPVSYQNYILPPVDAPEWTDDEEITSCTLTSAPDHGDDDCIVLIFGKRYGYFYSLARNNNSAWSSQNLTLDGEKFQVSSAVTCNQVTYCGLDFEEYEDEPFLFTVKLEHDDYDDSHSLLTWRFLELKLPSIVPGFTYRVDCLIESCGKVYMTSIFKHGRENMKRVSAVKVWEMDLLKMRWAEVEDLCDRAFFIDINGGSTWLCRRNDAVYCRGHGVEGNCIYFIQTEVKESSDYETLYVYRLADHSLTLLSPPLNLATTHYHGVWVLPHEKRDNFFSMLPLDMITLVSKYLHLFDYSNFRATCKRIRSALPSAQWRSHNSLPLLILKSVDSVESYRVMDPCRTYSWNITINSSSEGHRRIDFSKNGWLLIGNGYFNPFTSVKGLYPPTDWWSFDSVGFSTFPTSPDCLTVGIASFDLEIFYFHCGQEKWKSLKVSSTFEEENFEPSSTSPVYHNEAFYFLDMKGFLGEFKLLGANATWKVYPKPQTSEICLHSTHLMECDGELLSVFVGDVGKWIQMFRFNHAKEKWAEVRDLGNHILFLGQTSSSAVLAREPWMRNRIYLPRMYNDRIMFYSLETRKYHTFESEECKEDICGTTEPVGCCWI